MQSFVKSLGKAELLDLVVQTNDDSSATRIYVEDLRPSKKKMIYEEVDLGLVLKEILIYPCKTCPPANC